MNRRLSMKAGLLGAALAGYIALTPGNVGAEDRDAEVFFGIINGMFGGHRYEHTRKHKKKHGHDRYNHHEKKHSPHNFVLKEWKDFNHNGRVEHRELFDCGEWVNMGRSSGFYMEAKGSVRYSILDHFDGSKEKFHSNGEPLLIWKGSLPPGRYRIGAEFRDGCKLSREIRINYKF